jgi:MoaA/NifB/PqqE/SkfB family radical SAM enzyme
LPEPSIELWLELETACNLACRFCYNYWKDGSAVQPATRSTTETAAALRRLFETVQVTQVAFSGGEPLLRADLPDLLRVARSYGVRAILTTNGTLLTTKRIHELRQAGVDTFQISLHSHLPEVHDSLSGGAAWHAAIAAMIRVREACAPLVPVFVATAINLSHFPDVVRLLSYLRVGMIIFNRFIPTGLGTLYRREIGVPSEESLIRTLGKADEIAQTHGMRIQLGTPVDVPQSVFSKWRNIDLASCPVEQGQRRWTLSADLKLRRCNQSGADIGSVFDVGLERLISELARVPSPGPSGVRTCSHLAAERLVQLV